MKQACWGAGPWDDEPDYWEGEHKGFAISVLRQYAGHLCGYLEVSPGHPWHGHTDSHKTLRNVQTYKGITYAQPSDNEIDWEVGFDCAHSGDLVPGHHEMFAEFRSRTPDPLGLFDDKYRTFEMVKAEVIKLAEKAFASAKRAERRSAKKAVND